MTAICIVYCAALTVFSARRGWANVTIFCAACNTFNIIAFVSVP